MIGNNDKYLESVGEVRKKLSIATVELSSLKENRKLTKRGKNYNYYYYCYYCNRFSFSGDA